MSADADDAPSLFPPASTGEMGGNPGLKVGQMVVVRIDDIGFGGEGVARIGEASGPEGSGFVVFVPFVLVGEVVEIEVTEVKKRFARGRVVELRTRSPERVEPLCRYFGECGGCQYQHIAYERQLEIKRKQVADLFERIGGFSREVVAPVVPCPTPYGYRNRIMIRSQWDKFKQGLNIGFIRADNRLVVDIEECKIAEPALNQEIKRVRAHPPPKGGLKVVLRVAPEGWEVPGDSFFQNNFFLLPELVRTVRRCLEGAQTKFLIDAYCGVGFFSIELADLVEGFVGVELDALAIRAARKNAASRRVKSGEFREGRTEELLPGLLSWSPLEKVDRLEGSTVPSPSPHPSPLGRGRPEAWALSPLETTVILDPPRTGCPAPMLELLRQSRPKQVIYVSCHPATLARDLNILCAKSVFDVKNVIPLDMFPQTQHVECVADVQLRT